MFVGNAMHGNYAAVFAQLIVNGRSQGLLLAQKARIIFFTITIFQQVLYPESAFYGTVFGLYKIQYQLYLLNIYDDKIYDYILA